MSDIIAMCLADPKLGALDTDECESARRHRQAYDSLSSCSDVSPGGNLKTSLDTDTIMSSKFSVSV